MSAIFGIHYLDGRPVQPQLLEEMSKTLSHRGSDNTGIWHDGSAGFGHRMLWTTPESLSEHLPKSIQSGNLTITADARIDNRDDLLSQLGLTRYAADKTISDSEIILHAYEKWGEGCTSKLIGDFAFAIWDKQNRSVFCARDHFGVRPFYYYFSGNLFVFASEIKAILCVDEIPRVLNELCVGNLLTAVYDDTSSTFYNDIVRLPSGHQLAVNRSEKKPERYWSLDPSREIKLGSNEEYAENFKELFTETVRCRMRSAFPVGSLLSGGLDSSSITCTANKILTENPNICQNRDGLHTFSAIFKKSTKSDESKYINSVLSSGNFKPNFLNANEVSPMGDLEFILKLQDEPRQVGNHYILWNIFKLVKSQGVRVLLDGFDGDTTVSHGKMYLLELARERKWLRLSREAKGYAKINDESSSALIWAYFWRFGLDKALSRHRILSPVRRVGRRLYNRSMAADKYPPLGANYFSPALRPGFTDRIQLMEHQKAVKALLPDAPKTEREDHYLQFLKGITPFILEMVNKSAAAHGVEMRYPFWDRRLAEFCLSLPANQKMDKGFTRVVMRRAMEGILPKDVQWRHGKSDLSDAFDSGVQSFEYDRLQTIRESMPDVLEKFMDTSSLADSYDRFLEGKPTVPDTIKVSTSVSLALWLQTTEFTS